LSFRLEADLTEPIVAWLEGAGLDVRIEVPILGRRADLLGLGTGTVTAVEMKLKNWVQALRQAIAYQLAADRSWVAMPLAGASRAYRQRWRFEVEGVGLLAVDDHGGVRTAIPAGPSPRLLPFLRDGILEATRHETEIPRAPPSLPSSAFPNRGGSGAGHPLSGASNVYEYWECEAIPADEQKPGELVREA
jgi:hypothetical protein